MLMLRRLLLPLSQDIILILLLRHRISKLKQGCLE
jgi:hypothetical protein